MWKGVCYMKICIINGSPEAGKSTSGLLIGYLMPFIKGNEIITYNVCEMHFSKIQFSPIQSSDVLIFVFPLYIDSINSALLRFLIELQKLYQNILSLNHGEDLFISPDWPRFLWKIQASLCFWYPRAKKNGLKIKELKDKTNSFLIIYCIILYCFYTSNIISF